MERDGTLRLDLTDVFGNRLREKVDVSLRHQTLSDRKVARGVNASTRFQIGDLYGDPQGRYRIEIDPPTYQPISRFVTIKASGVTSLQIRFPIDARKVRSVDFPAYQTLPNAVRTLLDNSGAVSSFQGTSGENLSNSLDNIRRSGFLNITKKAEATPLSNGSTVLPYFRKLMRLRGDRFFVEVAEELRDETINSVADDLLRQVSGALHEPPPGFEETGSFKTYDSYGNLQLTFFSNGTDTVADIDIDDAASLAHVFQVARNWLSGRPTHPYDIHQILVCHQELDPGYRFVV